jgi:3-hydroxy-9,10-secoandrosta-1,3,5(10)-triene-9,17-dione monooxygenase reductase component
MSARRRVESGSQHLAGIADITDFTGRGGYAGHNAHGGNGHGGNGHGGNSYGGVHRSERQSSSADFRAVMGNFATGVTIITTLEGAGLDGAGVDATNLTGTGPDGATLDGPRPVGFTCQAFTSLSLDPPLISFAVSLGSSSRPRILAAGRFCINILAFDQRGLCARFATPRINRFAGVHWWHSPGGSPVLDGSLAWIDCTVEAEYPGGDHAIVIGRVRGMSYLRDAAPLVFHRGEFANCFPATSPGALPRVS